jgi:plastocyanin
MQGMQFSPTCARVPMGTEVVFTNDDTVAHTVTTDAGQAESFDSGTIAPGSTYRHTFATAGTIAIHCSIHSNMHLSVVVQ